MGLLYMAGDMSYWAIWLFILFALMAFNELGRSKPWAGITLFGIVSILASVLSIVQILSDGDMLIWASTILTTIMLALVTALAVYR